MTKSISDHFPPVQDKDHDRAARLEAALGADRCLEALGDIADSRYKVCVLVLHDSFASMKPLGDAGVTPLLQTMIRRFCQAKPALCLALVEANLGRSQAMILEHNSVLLNQGRNLLTEIAALVPDAAPTPAAA